MRFVNGTSFSRTTFGLFPNPPFKFSKLDELSISLHTAGLPSASVSNQVHETALLLSRGIHFMDWAAAVDLVNLPINALVTTS
jgi:hypothetical protein